jgi:hypothetical protein
MHIPASTKRTYGGQHDYRNRMQCVTLDHDYIVFALDVLGEVVNWCIDAT